MNKLGQLDLIRIGIPGNGYGLPVFLSRMVPGQSLRIDRLPLYKLSEDNRPVRTNYFLEGTLRCQESGKFFFELRAKFGKKPPREAYIKVFGTEISPVTLVTKGTPLQVIGLPFETPPGKDKVTFIISTDGSNDVPKNLFTALRNTPSEGVDDDNPTTPIGFPQV